ncbi:hypothetical protein [Sphingopyxis macrogoltabida]|uniref:hypothetical protein n=1 Tax=Sphingopyxis macrogoltabida TaxID=33050 RepID=UPI000AD0D8B4|nr:hypothetical protein [Sphingopyxis macrogoltabida]
MMLLDDAREGGDMRRSLAPRAALGKAKRADRQCGGNVTPDGRNGPQVQFPIVHCVKIGTF